MPSNQYSSLLGSSSVLAGGRIRQNDNGLFMDRLNSHCSKCQQPMTLFKVGYDEQKN